MAEFVVLIGGNICVGKTTLLNYIKKEENRFKEFLTNESSIKVVPEFIDPTLRKLFYSNRKEYSSWFEQSCLIGRIGRHLEVRNSQGIAFFDRGMIEGAETFCRNSYEEGYLRREAFDLYKKILYNGLDDLDRTRQKEWLERLIVYLKVQDEEILLKRSRIRMAEGEDLSLQYLRKINTLYERFIHNINEAYACYHLSPPQILTVDASVDFYQEPEFLLSVLELIIKKIREMQRYEL